MPKKGEQEIVFTPENIASSECLFDVKLSPDAKQLLYLVKPLYKSGEHQTCAIWLGEVDRAESASQFTSGLFNDHAARFHPDGKRILFLSDRHKAGGPVQIYSIGLQGGEAHLLFGKDNKRGVSEFDVSPDGRYVAFTSADEATPEDERRKKEKDDAQVFGDKSSFNHLRLYSFTTGDVRTLEAAQGHHVDRFLWSSDNKSLVYLSRKNSALEFTQEEAVLKRITVSVGAQPEVIGRYPRSPSGLCLLPTGEIVDIQSYEPGRISDSKSVFIHSSEDFSKIEQLYGKDDDAVRVVDMKDGGFFAVEIADSMETKIDVPRALESDNVDYTVLFRTDNEALERNSWDARRLADGRFVLAAIKSSAVNIHPPNVWTGTSDRIKLSLTTKLSSHLSWMAEGPNTHSELTSWLAKDRTWLEGIMTFPAENKNAKAILPYPTIMLIHGGKSYGSYPEFTEDHLSNLFFRSIFVSYLMPYELHSDLIMNRRVTFGYSSSYHSWHHLLAAQGYLVISPNYRGGQGRGSEFARAAHGGMGTIDWSDCESLLDRLIDDGIVDPNRLGIGGWSQGGFLTAWGVAKTKKRFKAGVMGAGVSDWGMLIATSDLPDFEADLGGCAPWDTPDASQRSDIRGNPIGHVTDVETAMLILHGEKDERVPASQGIAFFRGLRRHSKYPERHQLVIYPREPHLFTERNHAKDVMKRVVEYFTTWV
ncbi:hypothetical protein ACEPAH_7928 [Sanghuangporus vaninii]